MSRNTRISKASLFYLFCLLGLSACRIAAAQDPPPPSEPPPAANTAQNPSDTQSEQPAESEPAGELGLSNPRATMTVFLSAMDDVNQGKIERYVDALTCLDLSGLDDLPENTRNERGRELATQLEEFLGRLIESHEIDVELAPDQPEGNAFTCYETGPGKPAIQLERDAEGTWRFTWDSLEFVENMAKKPPTPAAEPQPIAEAPPPAAPVTAEPAADKPTITAPQEFQSARATMRTFLDAMKEKRIDDAAACLDLSGFSVVIRDEQGHKLAEPLYETISRVKTVVIRRIPDKPDDKPYIHWQGDKGGIIAIARQGEDSDRPGHWLFTSKTANWLAGVYTVPRWLRPYVPEWATGKWFLMQHWQWVGSGLLLVLGWVAYRLTIAVLGALARLWFARHGVAVDERVQLSSFRPVGILAMAMVWWRGLIWISPPADLWAVLLFAVKFITCWATVWTVYRAVDLLSDYVASLAAKTETKMDDMLVPFGRKVAKTLITILGVVFIVDQFTEETPLKLLAGLGLGGLALALAAQDTLKNLFGSATVLADSPFKVGDWVQIGDVDGTVESVGFRSTRIRTFYNSQVVVPNSTLMTATVDNYGARRYRRALTMLSVTYATPPDLIDAFCEGVRELIRLHPYTRKDYYHVYFNKFSDSSLDILLYVFFEAPDWSTELRERHRLFIDILRLANKLGVEFAFPTQTLWMERAAKGAPAAERVTLSSGTDTPESVGREWAAKAFEEAYGAESTRRGPVIIDPAPLSRRCRRSDGDDKGP